MKNTNSIRREAQRIQRVLKEKKYMYEVEHVRPMFGFESITPDGPDTMLSRAEFNTAVKNGTYRNHLPPQEGDDKFSKVPLTYGRFVEATGGFTKVTIIPPNGEPMVTKYSHHDNFCKSLGFVRAVSKALGREIA